MKTLGLDILVQGLELKSISPNYIKKHRKHKEPLVRELAEEIGIHKFTLIKREGGRMPRYKGQISKLMKVISGVERFLYCNLKDQMYR